MKNSLVPIAVILIIMAVFLIFNSSQAVKNVQQTLDAERYQRMTAEEKLQQAERRIRFLEAQVGESQSKIDKIQAILNDKEIESQDIAGEFDRMSQEKAALEIKLKEYESNVGRQQGAANP